MKTYRVYLTDRDSSVEIKSVARYEITEDKIVFINSLDRIVAVFIANNIKGFREVQ
jgi:hypothetical protein